MDIAPALPDILADRLAAMIISGEFPDGTRLPAERSLMQRFGVGRNAVREAITRLAQRGLLITRPGFRPVVRKPDYRAALSALDGLAQHLLARADDVRSLFESRIFFEAALVRHVAMHAKPADIAALDAALLANRVAIGTPDFYRTDAEFHHLFYRIPGNPIYPAVHGAYTQWLTGIWETLPGALEFDRINHTGHLSIFDAIVARDADAAEAALRRHLEFAWELVRDSVASMDRSKAVF